MYSCSWPWPSVADTSVFPIFLLPGSNANTTNMVVLYALLCYSYYKTRSNQSHRWPQQANFLTKLFTAQSLSFQLSDLFRRRFLSASTNSNICKIPPITTQPLQTKHVYSSSSMGYLGYIHSVCRKCENLASLQTKMYFQHFMFSLYKNYSSLFPITHLSL